MLNILIVDDSNLVCTALQAFVSAEKKFQVVGIEHDGVAALKLIKKNQPPDIVLMDLDMPAMGGIACTRKILDRYPGTKIIIISSLDNPQIVFCAIKNGAKGFLTKNDELSAGKLINAIWSVQLGQVQLDGKIAEQLFPPDSHLQKKSAAAVDFQRQVRKQKEKDLVLQDA